MTVHDGPEYACSDLWDLWRELLPEYRARVAALARRADSLSLGDYRLDEFNAVYASLIAVCAAHESLCYQWGQIVGEYPVESAVIVRGASEWVDILSRLSDVAPDKCQAMVADLTFSDRSLDLHVHPLMALDSSGEVLALAPPFPLHSRHDENILRVCSQKRPEIHDVTSLEKESEMRAVICAAGRRYAATGPINLPEDLPDIDLLMMDDTSSTLVVAELKWLRKTLRPAEIPIRMAELFKGAGQLGRIKAFLTDSPTHLARLGRLPKAVTQFEHVYYLLIARDFFRWVEPQDGIAFVEFETLVRVLESSQDLQHAIRQLLTYDWLPIEGTDFTVRYVKATVNGVSIESEVFYSAAPA